MLSRDSSTDDRRLAGLRVLIIEDSPVVGPFTADLLSELGCNILGPAPTMATARELVETGGYDAALMDIHIRGERVFPLCELLDAKGVPFILTSGYADWQMPEKWESRPRLQKPYKLDDVEQALNSVLSPEIRSPAAA